MKMPDDMELKAEIETVQQYYPVCEPPSDASTARPETDQTSDFAKYNQKPEQEA